LISVYIADEVFEDHPEIDEDDLQGAESIFLFKKSEIPISTPK